MPGWSPRTWPRSSLPLATRPRSLQPPEVPQERGSERCSFSPLPFPSTAPRLRTTSPRLNGVRPDAVYRQAGAFPGRLGAVRRALRSNAGATFTVPSALVSCLKVGRDAGCGGGAGYRWGPEPSERDPPSPVTDGPATARSTVRAPPARRRIGGGPGPTPLPVGQGSTVPPRGVGGLVSLRRSRARGQREG